MGSVWVARHLQLDIDVAVKVMVPEYATSDEARLRFEREARASARLRSPYVAHVYDYGDEQGTLFLVMELLHGEDLSARLRRVGRLTPAEAAGLVDQICKALECAHEAKLVHRDLKPANIFLTRHGRDDLVKVLDFGIAKVMDLGPASAITRTGELLGTPYYMSPEQVRRSRDVDPRSDLWSLGVIVYECLTGRLPFVSPEIGELLVAILTENIPPASQIVPEIGPEVERFLARALARNVAQRFQSARELAEAFAAAVAATPQPPVMTGADAPAAESPGGAAPLGVSAASLPSGTLAPTGGTLAGALRPRRSKALLALLGGTIVLGLAAAVIVLRGHSSDARAGTQGDGTVVSSDVMPSSSPSSSVGHERGDPRESTDDARRMTPDARDPRAPATGAPAPLTSPAAPSLTLSTTATAAAATARSIVPRLRPRETVPSPPPRGNAPKELRDPLEHR
jgi:serine/threonine-protein kinase